MVGRNLDHPGPNKWVLVEQLVLQPGARCGYFRRNPARLPIFTMDAFADNFLNFAKSEDLVFAEQQAGFERQFVTAVDHAMQGVT